MKTSDFLNRLNTYDADDAVIDGSIVWDYADLLKAMARWTSKLTENNIEQGTVVSLESDHSAEAIAALLALLVCKCIVVPLMPGPRTYRATLRDIAQVEVRITPGCASGEIVAEDQVANHPIYDKLRAAKCAGLVLYTSGTTAEPKAVVHNVEKLLGKFAYPGRAHRTMAFLRFDHIGGIDTVFYTLAYGGTVICPDGRDPHSVCRLIANRQVEVLPASPSFLRLMALAETGRSHDLSSLRTVTYGTEVMTQSVLDVVQEYLPGVKLLQRYGLSEIGALRSRSDDNKSTWLQLDPRIAARVVDDQLEVKTETAMLGYLNAPSPFTEDGWLRTGDMVEIDQRGFLRILGRASDIINVGGRKVHPHEVEDVVMTMAEVVEARAFGVENALLGEIVGLRVRLAKGVAQVGFDNRIWAFCRDRLPDYKVPRLIDFEVASIPKNARANKKN
jgi:acyl-coenzyme A synthetase/AMP-(fatty) acid ligase